MISQIAGLYAAFSKSYCWLQPLPLRGFDEECRKFIAEQYEVAGLNIHSQSTPTRIEKKDDGTLTLHVQKKSGKEEAIEGLEVVLMATGRSPNTQNMNLEKVKLSHSLRKWNKVSWLVSEQQCSRLLPVQRWALRCPKRLCRSKQLLYDRSA